jgi:hypothetical protein
MRLLMRGSRQSNHRLTHVLVRQASLQDIPPLKIVKPYALACATRRNLRPSTRDVGVTTTQRDDASTVICVDYILRDSLVGGDHVSDATTHTQKFGSKSHVPI